MRCDQTGASTTSEVHMTKSRILAGFVLALVPLEAARAQDEPPAVADPSTEAETRNQDPSSATEQGSTAAQPEGTDSSIETVRTTTGEIIVTARRFVPGAAFANKSNIPLIETPQSVSVITRDQIDLLNFVDAQQAVRYTSGVFGENYGPDLRFDFFTVRGFTPKQYIDGLAAPVSTTIFSTGVRRQNIWRNSRRRLAECRRRLGVDIRRRACGAASADVRWSVA